MIYKQREVETIMFYGDTMEAAHIRFIKYCENKHVIDTKMGTTPDKRAFICAVLEKRIDKRTALNEG